MWGGPPGPQPAPWPARPFGRAGPGGPARTRGSAPQSALAGNSSQDWLHLRRMEAEWARLALVGDAAVAVDYVQAVWPAGVGFLGGVLDPVHQRWNINVQVAHACVRHVLAFFGGF